jgi:hypothetical protein
MILVTATSQTGDPLHAPKSCARTRRGTSSRTQEAKERRKAKKKEKRTLARKDKRQRRQGCEPTWARNAQKKEITERISTLSFVLCNARSITTPGKIQQLRRFAVDKNHSLIFITESWLTPSIADRELEGDGFVVVGRSDRPAKKSSRAGGGVLILAHVSLPVVREISSNNGTEVCFCSLWCSLGLVYFGCVYRAPNNIETEPVLEDLVEKIRMKDNPASIILLGDFNAHNHQSLNDAMLRMNFTQRVTSPTRKDALLDMIWSDLPVKTNVGDEFSDHRIVTGNMDCGIEIHQLPERIFYDYRIADWRKINVDIKKRLNINSMNTTNSDQDCTRITRTIQSLMRKHIPHSIRRNVRASTCWWDNECETAYTSLDGTDEKKTAFRELCRLKFDQHIDATKQKLVSCNLGSKSFWRICKQSSGIGKFSVNRIPMIKNNDCYIQDDQQKADIFADYFDGKFNVSDGDVLDDLSHPEPQASMNKINVTTADVLHVISSMQEKKSSGPDHISVKLLKMTRATLSPILASLYNKILTSRKWPEIWKRSWICPVLKPSKSPKDTSSYRPVSLICVCSRILETILSRKIMEFYEKAEVLPVEQYAYRKGRSVDMMLVDICASAVNNLQNHGRYDWWRRM